VSSELKESDATFEEETGEHSTIGRFEHEWKIIVDFGQFMFGLANTGVQFTYIGVATWVVLWALGYCCLLYL
jgi:Na+:H+ antiporter, NhaA family